MAVNQITGRRYIGATRAGLVHRRKAHISAALKGSNGSAKFYRSIRKYGPGSFKWLILATPNSVKKMFEAEIRLIAQLKPELNITRGGDVNSKQLAKTRMAKSVLDAGWSTFRAMLKYKSAGYMEVDEKFTTQTCSHCGALPPERPKGIAGLGIRHWECSECDASHDRDVNAAKNILIAALSAQRRGDESRRAA